MMSSPYMLTAILSLYHQKIGYKPSAVAHGGNPQDRAALRIHL